MSPGIWHWACCCGGGTISILGDHGASMTALNNMLVQVTDAMSGNYTVYQMNSFDVAMLGQSQSLWVDTPTSLWTADEATAISTWLTGNPLRKLVLLCQQPYVTAQAQSINSIASRLGLNMRTGSEIADQVERAYSTDMTIETSYLTTGIAGLGPYTSDRFRTGVGRTSGTPQTYTYMVSQYQTPWSGWNKIIMAVEFIGNNDANGSVVLATVDAAFALLDAHNRAGWGDIVENIITLES